MTGSAYTKLGFVVPGASALVINSAKSSPMFAASVVTPATPGQVTGLTSTLHFDRVSLTWTAPSGTILGYLIEQRPHAGGTWTTIDHASTTPAADITALTLGVEYDFRVSAYGPGGVGVVSEVVVGSIPTLYETGALGHWLLGSSNPTMADLISGQILRQNLYATLSSGGSGYTSAPTITASDDSQWTCAISSGAVGSEITCTNPGTGTGVPTLTFSGGGGTGAAATVTRGVAPTQSAGYLTTVTSSTVRNGLLTPFTDALDQTMFGVFKCRSTDIKGLHMGTMGATGVTGGDTFYRESTGIYYSNRRGSTQVAATTPAGLVANAWFFVIISTGSSGTYRRVFIGGNSASESTTVTKVAAARKIAVGNGSYEASTFAGGVDVAEFGYFSTAKTEAEMLAIYLRSKARMADRGITII